MQESSKKARNSSVKQTVKKTQPKTVRVYSKKISDEEFARMSELSDRFCGQVDAWVNKALSKSQVGQCSKGKLETTLYWVKHVHVVESG
jgi:hypothetical protein